MTIDSPSDWSGHVIPAPLPNQNGQDYNYLGSNYAFWEIGTAEVRGMTGNSRAGDGAILHLTVLDALGEPVEVPLRFLELQGRPHVVYSTGTEPKWVSVALNAPFVRWRIGHDAFIGAANLVGDPTRVQTEVLPNFYARFGRETVSRWFGRDMGCIELVESPGEPPYYDEVEALFDRAAPVYDQLVEGDRLNIHLRKVSQRLLRQLFPPGTRVLEIGCGTGLETIPLAQTGVDVVAVDICAKMLEELNKKISALSLRDRIERRKGSASELPAVVHEFGPGSFDGAFSHFGALNCEPHLDPIPAALHQLLRSEERRVGKEC